MHPRLQFVIGGARSGKSHYAETLALAQYNAGNNNAASRQLVYLATAEAFDDEMQARIDQHKARRGDEWQLCDAPIELAKMIQTHDHKDAILLIDCASIWTSNLLCNDLDVDAHRKALMSALDTAVGTIIVVASETGLGIVPDNRLSRQFRDANGYTNQAIAQKASSVFFLVAGIAQKVKSTENPLL